MPSLLVLNHTFFSSILEAFPILFGNPQAHPFQIAHQSLQLRSKLCTRLCKLCIYVGDTDSSKTNELTSVNKIDATGNMHDLILVKSMWTRRRLTEISGTVHEFDQYNTGRATSTLCKQLRMQTVPWSTGTSWNLISSIEENCAKDFIQLRKLKG